MLTRPEEGKKVRRKIKEEEEKRNATNGPDI